MIVMFDYDCQPGYLSILIDSLYHQMLSIIIDSKSMEIDFKNGKSIEMDFY